MDDNKNKPMGWPILYTLATLAGVAVLAILKACGIISMSWPSKKTGACSWVPGLGFKEWYSTSCHMYYEIASAVTKKNIKAGTCPYCHRPIKIKEERKHGL